MAQTNIKTASKLAISNKSKSLYYRFRYMVDDKIIYEPDMEILRKHKSYIIANSDYVSLDVKYHRKPWLLSYDKYGSVDLWYLLLYINDVTSIMDFTIQNIYIPPRNIIYEFISDYIPDNSRLPVLQTLTLDDKAYTEKEILQ